jgi:hypothetical protein
MKKTKKSKKEKEELIKNDRYSKDPSLKEVIEYENEDGENLIKDISNAELKRK